MRIVAGIAGVALLLWVLWDAFEVFLLPRRVTRRFRFARFYYRTSWRPWAWLGDRMRDRHRHEAWLGIYGPLSVVGLAILWAVALLVAFALMLWGFVGAAGRVEGRFATDLYLSGTTFFTLGLGDVLPSTSLARFLAVLEAGTGFGFLAVVISYLPVLYAGFARREASITLLDARAGSPPTAAELLRRQTPDAPQLAILLAEWERWAANLLESHISYPVLGYFRSQHDNQSWLAALATVLDASALVLAGACCTESAAAAGETLLSEGGRGQAPAAAGADAEALRQAHLTYAMGRHAVVDLTQVFGARPLASALDRLPNAELARLQTALLERGMPWRHPEQAARRLAHLRQAYEPYLTALAAHLRAPLPQWLPASDSKDNWQTSGWEGARRADG
ncbi:MAG: potassium channel family protein [Terriglobales bacterium]